MRTGGMKSTLILGFFCLSCSLNAGNSAVFVCPPSVSPLEEGVWGVYHWEVQLYTPRGRETRYVASGTGLWLDLDPQCPAVVSLRPLAGSVPNSSGSGHTAPSLSLPAGALWPWDASGPSELATDWLGGIRACFFLEMARREFPGGRQAANFNWPRFRGLLESGWEDGTLPEDLWSVDWALVARQTLNMGFDSRRIRPDGSVWSVGLPAGEAVWLSDNPFSRESWNGGEFVSVAGRAAASWLRCDEIFSASSDGFVHRLRSVE